ncbi:MAG: NAD(+) synthase [Lachnospiraceae bacterium]|nr:NAD(+) synthase [Candidatus Colinaster scatohippi]
MKDGFVKVAAITPSVKVADVEYNGAQIRKAMSEAVEKRAKVVVFPELCITSYTCQDLFHQESLINSAKDELIKIAEYSTKLDGLFFVGLPMRIDGALYNMAAAISEGKILGLVPKIYMPNYNEFYEARHFTPGNHLEGTIQLNKDIEVNVGTKLIFQCRDLPELKVAAEICEDLWVPNPPSTEHAIAGANLIVNLSASDELTGKSGYRRELVVNQSARLICAYVYCSAGDGESTQDVVYSGQRLIAENGGLLREGEPFSWGMITADIDVKRLEADRCRMTTFTQTSDRKNYTWIPFTLKDEVTKLERFIDPRPFVPSDKANRDRRCEEILMIQASGLKKRLEHINCKTAVIGVSGGLDSTLALLVTVKAFDLLGKDHKEIIGVTMPGFGTTGRTYDNAVKQIRNLGCTFKEIPINEAVEVHFRDIGQDMSNHDVTYENGQARERTQILMDVANKEGGIVIGTGDLSELALGWATYNGDHMSMYAVNVSIPKTLVRYLVQYYADVCDNEELKQTLSDVLATPVSPELIPAKDGVISQITEDLVGPYELHDFFLYHMLRYGASPSKINRMANYALGEKYNYETILKWEKVFYKRFFAQQFKRSCLPDGPKVGSIAVSPRGDLRMPSDACGTLWMKELDNL